MAEREIAVQRVVVVHSMEEVELSGTQRATAGMTL